MMISHAAELLANARHKCPKGYRGPCWGTTNAEYEKAERELRAAKKSKAKAAK